VDDHVHPLHRRDRRRADRGVVVLDLAGNPGRAQGRGSARGASVHAPPTRRTAARAKRGMGRPRARRLCRHPPLPPGERATLRAPAARADADRRRRRRRLVHRYVRARHDPVPVPRSAAPQPQLARDDRVRSGEQHPPRPLHDGRRGDDLRPAPLLRAHAVHARRGGDRRAGAARAGPHEPRRARHPPRARMAPGRSAHPGDGLVYVSRGRRDGGSHLGQLRRLRDERLRLGGSRTARAAAPRDGGRDRGAPGRDPRRRARSPWRREAREVGGIRGVATLWPRSSGSARSSRSRACLSPTFSSRVGRSVAARGWQEPRRGASLRGRQQRCACGSPSTRSSAARTSS